MTARDVFVVLSLFGVICFFLMGGCDQAPTVPASTAGLPAEFKGGEAKFNAHCSKCHGIEAKGTNQGPPLVHKYYEPSHHGDAAFFRAAANGVRSHHFSFGDMPALPDVTQEDLRAIVPYVRWLQRQAGIT